jgi:hypothetical protein
VVLLLDARFRGHDEKSPVKCANFCTRYQAAGSTLTRTSTSSRASIWPSLKGGRLAWNSVQAAVTPAENVRTALLFASRGEAPLGIVYAPNAAADPRVEIAGGRAAPSALGAGAQPRARA